MRVINTLAFFAVWALAFAGTASASQFTSPSGTTYTGELKAESENGHIKIESEEAFKPFTVECQSGFALKAERHGASVTPGGNSSFLAFSNCTNGTTVVVNKAGSLEAHALGSGTGTVTSSGAEITVHVAGQNIKCIYTTKDTDIGILFGGTPGTMSGNKLTINRTGGSVFCGPGGFLFGSYKFTTPTSLFVS